MSSTPVVRLIDTNVLVYRFDPRDPIRQNIATQVLREGLIRDDVVVPHQALIEFVAATTRPRADLGGRPLLDQNQALAEAESLMRQFRMIYPTEETLTTALRGVAAYQLSWFDAHLWAYAETNGIPEILTEGFEHGRHYGHVRVVNPFAASEGDVQELPPLYA